MPIRRPAPLDRLKDKPEIDKSHYQHFDILYVQDKFPALDLEVATRLGRMISRRRQLLSYRRSHQERLQTGESAPETATPAPPIATQAASGAIASERNESRAAGSERGFPTKAMTRHTTATTLLINTPEVETSQALCPPSDAGSGSSRASSYTEENLHVEVPPRPKGGSGGKLETCECPYCFILKTIKTDSAWK